MTGALTARSGANGALSCHPATMCTQRPVTQQIFKAVKLLGQCHLIEQRVNAAVALSANIDSASQLLAAVVFLEKLAPVHLSRNQVMKGEIGVAIT